MLLFAFKNKKIYQLEIDDKFQSGKQQVLLVICGFDLESRLYGNQVVLAFTVTKTGENLANPAYAKF